ncbi:unnamed protein product [Albugo candida]|uniref:Uncharacterized protein n=1 Tax=Albugo candida TaxID=65357 RepID=A0A024GAS9_9STRA|nr:unnamed protein product [Albugo candida]|eukprot:CCI43784.1 unnamed protein product [Albugo candida]
MSEGYQRRIWKVSKELDRLSLTCQQHHLQTKQRDGLPEWKIPPSLPAGIASATALKRDQMHRRIHQRQSEPSKSVPLYFAWNYDDPNRDKCHQLRAESQSCLNRLQSSSQLIYEEEKKEDVLNEDESQCTQTLNALSLCDVVDGNTKMVASEKPCTEQIKEKKENDRPVDHSQTSKIYKSKVIAIKPCRRKAEQCRGKSDEAYGVAKRLERDLFANLLSDESHDTVEACHSQSCIDHEIPNKTDKKQNESHSLLADEGVQQTSRETNTPWKSESARWSKPNIVKFVEASTQTTSDYIDYIERRNFSTQTTAEYVFDKPHRACNEGEQKGKYTRRSMTTRRKPIQRNLKKESPIFLYQRYPPESQRLCERTTYKTSFSKRKSKMSLSEKL